MAWCGYADDFVLFLQSQKGLQKATNFLDEIFTRFGLSISKGRTETMKTINATPFATPGIVVFKELSNLLQRVLKY